MEVDLVTPDPTMLIIMFIGGMIFFWSVMRAMESYRIPLPDIRVRRYFMATLAVLAFFTFIVPVLIWRDLTGPAAEDLTIVVLPVVTRYLAFLAGVMVADWFKNRKG